jgi:hypothetical protein
MPPGRPALCLLAALALAVPAVWALPVPSQAPPAATAVTPAAGGSDATEAGLVIGITLSTMAGLIMLGDEHEGNDVYGYITLIPLAVVAADAGLLLQILIHIPWPL